MKSLLCITDEMDEVSAALEDGVLQQSMCFSWQTQTSVTQNSMELPDVSHVYVSHRGQLLLFHNGVCSRCCRTGHADILVMTANLRLADRKCWKLQEFEVIMAAAHRRETQ